MMSEVTWEYTPSRTNMYLNSHLKKSVQSGNMKFHQHNAWGQNNGILHKKWIGTIPKKHEEFKSKL